MLAPRDYHDVISKVASIKSLEPADIDKLQKLMLMQEDWEKRQAATNFNNMMSVAQGEMTRISKDSANPQTRSRYASLEALDEAIRPIYTRCGFSVSFDDETPDERRDGWLRCLAYVSNGAETRKFTKWIPISTTGIKGTSMMTPTHGSTAAMTYARRTLLKMIFNLAEEDHDGNLRQDQRDESTGSAAPDISADAIIEAMRACKDHTALYTYGQKTRPSYLKLGPDNRKLVDQIYRQLMDEFAEQHKDKPYTPTEPAK